MKKLLLSGAALALFATVFVSCGETKETKTETETTTTSTTEAEKPAEAPATVAASDAPTFSSEEVNKGLADYKALIAAYAEAYKSKDQAKITELSTQAQKFATDAASWGQKLKPEEMQKFSEYWQKLTQEWTAAVSGTPAP